MRLLSSVVVLGVIGLGSWWLAHRIHQPSTLTTTSPVDAPTQPVDGVTTPTSLTDRLNARTIDGAANEFTFSADIPAGWLAEAIPSIEAINVYDPAAEGSTNLEKSQLFIRHFEADRFLTLSTVTIHERTDTTVAGRPAVRYEIQKKGGVVDFPNQPSWRNARHIVTDVRVSTTNPSVFYVIAKRPDLDQGVYDRFLETFVVDGSSTSSFVEPVGEFKDRITKKPFGILTTPATSLVQPERFSGYHTAVDVEYEDVKDEVPVRAIADGKVVVARTADGYGGVVVVLHAIDGKNRAVIYGHLDPAALPKIGSTVERGEQIGRLGDGGTNETDGERKHLHLGIRTDEAVDLRGYVQTMTELASWLDPLKQF